MQAFRENQRMVGLGDYRKMSKLFKTNSKGYTEVRDINNDQGWVLEHRYAVEQFLKRELKSSEVVHHIDEVKSNNLISNLMVFSSQKEHSSFHNKIKRGMTRHIKEQIRNRWKTFK